MKREEVPTDGEEEVQSACGAGVAPLEKTQAHRPDRLYTWQELKGLPEPDWLIDGVPPKDGLTVLYGAPGLGKTFLALDWALQCAEAGQVVVYVVGEGISGIPKRVEAWLTEHSRPREQLSTFMVHSGAVEMLSTKAVGDFVRNVTNRLGERKPAMVVIDTLARCFAGGDENTAKDMGQLVASCDLFRSSWPGCSVLVLHHSGKDESKKARGSTVLLGAADCEMELKKQKGGLLQLRCTKMKDSDGFSAKTMQLKRRNGSCVLTPIRGKSIGDRAKKEIKGTGAILSALRKGPLARKKLLGRVRSKLGAYSDTTLGSALKPLITKRLVIKTDGGLYQLRAAAVPRSGPDTNHTGSKEPRFGVMFGVPRADFEIVPFGAIGASGVPAAVPIAS